MINIMLTDGRVFLTDLVNYCEERWADEAIDYFRNSGLNKSNSYLVVVNGTENENQIVELANNVVEKVGYCAEVYFDVASAIFNNWYIYFKAVNDMLENDFTYWTKDRDCDVSEVKTKSNLVLTDEIKNDFKLFVSSNHLDVSERASKLNNINGNTLYPIEFYWMDKNGNKYDRVVWFESFDDAQEYENNELDKFKILISDGLIRHKVVCYEDLILEITLQVE